jgi:hypothetical protein
VKGLLLRVRSRRETDCSGGVSLAGRGHRNANELVDAADDEARSTGEVERAPISRLCLLVVAGNEWAISEEVERDLLHPRRTIRATELQKVARHLLSALDRSRRYEDVAEAGERTRSLELRRSGVTSKCQALLLSELRSAIVPRLVVDPADRFERERLAQVIAQFAPQADRLLEVAQRTRDIVVDFS